MANQTLWGCVNADGTLHSGSDGVRTVRYDTGLYGIEFPIEFQSTPAVVLTQNFRAWNDFSYGGGDTSDNAVLVAVSPTACKVVTGDARGDHADRNFTFIAIGDIGYRE